MIAAMHRASTVLRVVLGKTIANAQMDLACCTDEMCPDALDGATTADCAIALLVHASTEVLVGKPTLRMEGGSTLAWCLLGWKLLHELVHEFLTEA